MEHANGVPLRNKWHKMAGNQQVRCISAIYRTIKDIVDLEFPAYGSIFLSDTLDSDGNQSWGDNFCVGTHCGTRYWDCDAGERRYYHYARKNHGPCKLRPNSSYQDFLRLKLCLQPEP